MSCTPEEGASGGDGPNIDCHQLAHIATTVPQIEFIHEQISVDIAR